MIFNLFVRKNVINFYLLVFYQLFYLNITQVILGMGCFICRYFLFYAVLHVRQK